jgi:hypothetical protein
MVEKKQVLAIVVSVILMSLMIAFSKGVLFVEKIPVALLMSLIITFVFVWSKQITAYKIETKLDYHLWQFNRYWIGSKSYFQKPIPIGLILPILLSFLSLGFLKFFAFIQFEISALPSRVAKKYGQRRFSGIMEWDNALIAFYGMIGLLALSFISVILSNWYFYGFFSDLARFSWIYAVSNLLPISKLEGTRMFFGSIPLFVFSWIVLLLSWPIVF